MGERQDIRRGYENMRDELHKHGMRYPEAEKKAREIALRNERGEGVRPNPRAHKNRET